ncbi:hypothetical protein [Paracnuella aquatica]|uniref:hypothetical protein n=1 Tax=Paracnuella aquatica TaxID=2268757 RepID=UPI000DEFD5CB|nr:hypothetical protein [Paracnuella aquatica]RPD50907.1 hypothetical protein DRJ53_05275 [Paracnuella aquatica]
MKKILLLLPVILFGLFSAAQCDKSVTFKCYKGREIKYGSAQQEMPFEMTLAIDQGKMNIYMAMDRATSTIQGEITEVLTCEWTEYLHNGKTRYKGKVTPEGGSMQDAYIEIESTNGQTKISFSSTPDDTSKLQFDVVDYTITEDDAAAPKAAEPAKRKKKS